MTIVRRLGSFRIPEDGVLRLKLVAFDLETLALRNTIVSKALEH